MTNKHRILATLGAVAMIALSIGGCVDNEPVSAPIPCDSKTACPEGTECTTYFNSLGDAENLCLPECGNGGSQSDLKNGGSRSDYHPGGSHSDANGDEHACGGSHSDLKNGGSQSD